MNTSIEGHRLGGAYSFLRQVVGVIAVTLPVVLVLGDVIIDRLDDSPFNSDVPLGSISSYYYERTGGYFVGSLFALAVFFLSYDYRPDEERSADNLLSSFASVMAVGVALLPTASSGGSATGGAKVVATLHIVCAATLFVLLAIFSLYQFTKTEGEVTSDTPWMERIRRLWRTSPDFLERMTPQKRRRNMVFRICGGLIALSLAIAGIDNLVQLDVGIEVFFWAETVAIMAFGVSWLVKGGFLGILADEDDDIARFGAWR